MISNSGLSARVRQHHQADLLLLSNRALQNHISINKTKSIHNSYVHKDMEIVI